MRFSTLKAAIAVVAGTYLLPSFASAQVAGFADLEQIDRLVEGFTGQPIGTAGGARQSVDRRLKLRNCAEPVALAWFGEPGRTVEVACVGQGGWRIYVNVLRIGGDLSTKPAVNRGDMITVAIKGRGFTVQKQGEAMSAGKIGDWIEIRTAKDTAPLRARIERPGLAIITAG